MPCPMIPGRGNHDFHRNCITHRTDNAFPRMDQWELGMVCLVRGTCNYAVTQNR